MCKGAEIDCDAGRRLGCQTFCCYLLLRVDPDEQVPGVANGLVEKGPDGACIHLDRENQLCRIWAQRPRICRGYHCNDDIFLQIVLRDGFKDIVTLARAAAKAYIPRETYVRVPGNNDES